MEEVLNFVTENYIWIIIISVVIVMTVIGYFADKTDFGKQSIKKSKKEKVSKEEYVPEEVNNNIEQPVSFSENLEQQETMPMEQLYETENIEQVAPAFDTDEMFDLNDVNLNMETTEYPEENVGVIPTNAVEEQPEEVLDKKELKRMQKEEAKRLKEEAKKLKEEEKRLKKESRNENNEEIAEEPEMENFYTEEVNPVSNEVEETVSSSSDLFEPMEDIALDVPNTDFDMEMEAPVENVTGMTEEPEMENFYGEDITSTSNQVEQPEVEMNEIPEIELPSIESLDKELDDYEEEDDVWKF